MSRLVVNEVYGPTVQGEGPSMGTPCGFVRLGGCNLSCSWCDTAFTWDWTGTSDMAKLRGEPFKARDELHPMEVHRVVTAVAAWKVPLLVVTGGEPLSQPGPLGELVEAVLLRRHVQAVEVETNGTVAPGTGMHWSPVRYNVSLKLSNSGDPLERRIVPDAVRSFGRRAAVGQAVFKFVAKDEADLIEIEELVGQHHLAPVWVMPLGQDREEITDSLQRIADGVIARRWNLTTRLHVHIWNDRRGV